MEIEICAHSLCPQHLGCFLAYRKSSVLTGRVLKRNELMVRNVDCKGLCTCKLSVPVPVGEYLSCLSCLQKNKGRRRRELRAVGGLGTAQFTSPVSASHRAGTVCGRRPGSSLPTAVSGNLIQGHVVLCSPAGPCPLPLQMLFAALGASIPLPASSPGPC